MESSPWKLTNSRLIAYAILFVFGAILATAGGTIRTGHFDHKAIALIGILMFIIFAHSFLHTITNIIYNLFVSHHLSVGRAGALKFLLQLCGYLAIALTTLDLFGISIAKLLLGGAIVGVILGVAAQQALANFFASIVLIFAHPFTIGEDIVLYSGTLGGKYVGKVMDLGLTHTRLKDEDGNIIYMPNATLLSAAAIMAKKHSKAGGSGSITTQ
jgi:small-conductance mechanosensitive channel